MKQGFLIYAHGEDYLKQAILCTMSILVNNPSALVSIVTNNKVGEKYTGLFDKIIDIPWYKKSDSRYQCEHRWKLYHVTPYDRTLVLDADTLVLQNIDNWWKYLQSYKIYYPSAVQTYRSTVVKKSPYRKAFVNNNLPDFYNVIHYFEKSTTAHEFYHWLELVCNNWELFYGSFVKENYPKYPSMDVSTAIVSKILHNEKNISSKKENIIKITHMKNQIQGWSQVKSSWIKQIGVYLNNKMHLIIGNYKQNGIFHYTEHHFVTDDIMNQYEKCLGII